MNRWGYMKTSERIISIFTIILIIIGISMVVNKIMYGNQLLLIFNIIFLIDWLYLHVITTKRINDDLCEEDDE